MNYQIQRIFFRFQILYNVKKQSNPYSHTNTKKVNFSSFILNYQIVTPIENTIDSHIHSHQYSKISFIFLILQTRRYEDMHIQHRVFSRGSILQKFGWLALARRWEHATAEKTRQNTVQYTYTTAYSINHS